jgi:hypothetical protein
MFVSSKILDDVDYYSFSLIPNAHDVFFWLLLHVYFILRIITCRVYHILAPLPLLNSIDEIKWTE